MPLLLNWVINRNIVILFWSLCILVSCDHESKKDLLIAAAANMQYAMPELIESFEAQHQLQCDLVIGSSGKLTTQIIQGAPYDIFFAADLSYPEEIRKTILDLDLAKIYATGELILAAKDGKSEILPSEILKNDSPIKIAIANPKFAPYGKAATEYLENLGIVNQDNIQVVLAESISQVNQYLLTSSVDVAVTSKSSLSASKLKDNVRWEAIDQSLYTPLSQSALVLNAVVSAGKEKAAKAALFLNFVLSPKGQAILQSNGYRAVSK